MNNKRGFTLIELTVMIAIGAILTVGMAVSAETQMKTVVDNRNFLIALNLAKRQMAIMNRSAYPAVVAETALTADSNFPNFIVTQEVVPVDNDGGSKSIREIRVRVRLDSISGAVLVILYTYRSDILSFGNGT